MIRRLVLTVGFAVASTIALTSEAQAQITPAPDETELVPFNGAVGSVCTFSNTIPGAFAVFSTSLVSNAQAGGTPGRTTVNCSDGGQITVANPQPVNVPTGFVASSSQSEITDPNNPLSGGNTSITVNSGAIPLEINMNLDYGGANLPSGVYEYNVPVTASPN